MAKSDTREHPRRFAMDLATDRRALSPRAVTRNSRRSQPTRSVCAITPCLRVLLLCVYKTMHFACCVQGAPQSSRQCRLSRGSVGPLQKRLSYFYRSSSALSGLFCLLGRWLVTTLRFSEAGLCLPPVNRVYYAKRDGLSGRAVAQRSSETLALGVRLVRSSNQR